MLQNVAILQKKSSLWDLGPEFGTQQEAPNPSVTLRSLKVFFMDPEEDIKKWRLAGEVLTYEMVIGLVNSYWNTREIDSWNKLRPVTFTPLFELTGMSLASYVP